VKKAQAGCRRIEEEMGLRHLKPGDGAAAKTPTSAERFKAERTGRTEPPRETLREAVRQARAEAATEAEFFTRLREAGLRVRIRNAPSGGAIGCNVALPCDRKPPATPAHGPRRGGRERHGTGRRSSDRRHHREASQRRALPRHRRQRTHPA
jgi:hypothetical protein